MVFSVGLGQSPNEMTLRVAAAAGLPDLNKALKIYGPMLRTVASRAAAGHDLVDLLNSDAEIGQPLRGDPWDQGR